MTEPAPASDIRIYSGFARAGSTLFWSSAAVVMALWAAQKGAIIQLGAWLTPIAVTLLFVGFTVSGLFRTVGTALHLVTRSSLATSGASAVSRRVAQLGFWPRLLLGFLPGAQWLTIADVIASVRDGSFAASMRDLFRMIGVVIGGGVLGVAAAVAGWQWWHGTAMADLKLLLVIAGIGAGLMLLLVALSGWVAQGFLPVPEPAASPERDAQ